MRHAGWQVLNFNSPPFIVKSGMRIDWEMLKMEGIVLSLTFATPSMASLTADQAPNYRIDEVSNFNVTNHKVLWNLVPDKAAQGRYPPY